MTGKLALVDRRSRIGKIELTHGCGRNHVHVTVGDLVPRDDQAYTLRTECSLLGFCDALRDQHQVHRFVVVEIDPLVDFANGNHESVAGRQGVDREEADADFVAVDDVRG